jgi:hypothetical protein
MPPHALEEPLPLDRRDLGCVGIHGGVPWILTFDNTAGKTTLRGCGGLDDAPRGP